MHVPGTPTTAAVIVPGLTLRCFSAATTSCCATRVMGAVIGTVAVSLPQASPRATLLPSLSPLTREQPLYAASSATTGSSNLAGVRHVSQHSLQWSLCHTPHFYLRPMRRFALRAEQCGCACASATALCPTMGAVCFISALGQCTTDGMVLLSSHPSFTTVGKSSSVSQYAAPDSRQKPTCVIVYPAVAYTLKEEQEHFALQELVVPKSSATTASTGGGLLMVVLVSPSLPPLSSSLLLPPPRQTMPPHAGISDATDATDPLATTDEPVPEPAPAPAPAPAPPWPCDDDMIGVLGFAVASVHNHPGFTVSFKTHIRDH